MLNAIALFGFAITPLFAQALNIQTTFSSQVLADASTMANMPADVDIVLDVENDSGKDLMTMQEQPPSAGGQVRWTLTVYVKLIKAQYNLRPRDLSSGYSRGILCGTYYHELAHKCDGGNEADPYSCGHVAIRAGTNVMICEKVATIMSTNTPPAPGSTEHSTALGLCAVHRENRVFMNNAAGAAAARACICGTPPYLTPNCPGMGMPAGYPAAGCGDATPQFIVLPNCPACDNL